MRVSSLSLCERGMNCERRMNELHLHEDSCTFGTVGCPEKFFFLLNLREEPIPITFTM
jgi:hypothetical protein